MNDHDCPARSCAIKQPSFYLNDISNDISGNNGCGISRLNFTRRLSNADKTIHSITSKQSSDKTNVLGRNSETTKIRTVL